MKKFSSHLFAALTLLSAPLALAQRPFYLLPGVHPGYSLVSMRPAGMEATGANVAPNVGGMAWLPNGKLFIASMSGNAAGGTNANRLGVSHGYLFTGIPGATSNAAVTAAQVSTGYQMPSGAVAVGDSIYVLDNEEGLTKLTPTGTGTYTKSTLYKGVLGNLTTLTTGSGYRSWTGGLVYGRGYFYAVVGMALIPGGTSEYADANLYRGKGTIYKISLNGAVVDSFASGVRNGVSLAWGPDSQMFYTDNQGSFMPASAIFPVAQNAYFGHPKSAYDARLRTPPAIIFPYGSSSGGGDANNPTVARVATDMLTLKDGRYKNQMLVGVNHTTGMLRAFMEKIPTGNPGEFVYQGAVFPFSQGFGVGGASGTTNVPTGSLPGVLADFRSNVNRMSYGTDGHIYLGGGNSPGANSGGSHGFDGGLQYGLARLVPNNDTVFEIKAIRSLDSTRMEVEFTEPVSAATTTNFAVRQWGHLQGGTSNNTSYGAGYQQGGVSTLTVSAVTLNTEKTKAVLTISGLKQRPVVVTSNSVEDRTWGVTVQIRVTGVSAVSNRAMWTDTASAKRGLMGWYTLNKFGPGQDMGNTTSIARGDAQGVRSGLMLKIRPEGVMLRSPIEGAYTVQTMDMRGKVLASHNVAAGRQEFLVPSSSLAGGITVIEARSVDGQRFTATTSRF